jgi:hypothetical protein
VAIVHDAYIARHVPKQESIVSDIRVVIRIRVPAPFQVTESASVTRIVAACVGAWVKSRARSPEARRRLPQIGSEWPPFPA